MALKISTALLLLLLFLGLLKVSHALADHIFCLKAIKASLDDPHGYLSSWNFNNNTEGFICKFTGVDCWHPDENRVFNLRLSGMGLKGSFPRGIKNCTSLTGLDLSYNNLYGAIPSDISYLLPYVTSLDLSRNNFSGEIPKSLGNCAYLTVLELDHNRLTGNLPEELGLRRRLTQFSVSNNLLSGPVPDFPTGMIMKDSYANNPELCGGPLEPCSAHKHETILDSFKLGFTISYVASAAAVFISFSFKLGFTISYVASAAAVFISFSFSWLQLKNMTMVLHRLQNWLGTKQEADELFHCSNLDHYKEIPGLERLVNMISLEELCRVTNNFSAGNVIGKGKTGTMYKATLHSGWFLAVKRSNNSPQFESRFLSELLALTRLKHHNIVPLLGFCTEKHQMILVYKYMSNGSLHDWLQATQDKAKRFLEWPLRLKIAIGIARGLSWLHYNCDFRVVHGEISSKSILLDDQFEPKISNFGKTIISNHGGVMFKYANDDDSGFLVNGGVWESDFVKEDVLKFGIVLLELLTWKEAINASSSTSSPYNNLVEWVNHVLAGSNCVLDYAIDKYLCGKGYDDEIMEVLRVAAECVQPFPIQRPTMLQVHKRISSLGEKYGMIIPCDSECCKNQDKTDTGDEILPVDQSH